MKRWTKALALVMTLCLMVAALAGCSSVAGTYTEKIPFVELSGNILDEATSPPGYFTTLGDEDSAWQTNTLTLEKDGTYTLEKNLVLDFSLTMEVFAQMAADQGAGPIDMKFVFTGEYEKNDDGTITLKAPAFCDVNNDMSMIEDQFSPADIIGKMTSDDNAELLNYFNGRYLTNSGACVDQVVTIDTDAKTVTFN